MSLLQKKSLLITIILGIQYYLLASLKIYLPLILMTLFITILFSWYYTLGFNLKISDIYEGSKFLILPVLFNFGAAFFVSSLTQPVVAYMLIAVILIANFYLTIALKKVFNLEDKAAIFQRNIIISVAFISVFLSIAALFRLYVSYSANSSFNFPLTALIALTAIIFFGVSYFLAWENGIDLNKFRPYNLVISLLGAEVAWVSSIWIINYPVFSNYDKAGLSGIPFPAVTLAIVFYFCWGIISHKSEHTLTRNVIFEYFILTIIFLAVLFASAQWLPQT